MEDQPEADALDGSVVAEPAQRLVARIVDTLVVGIPVVTIVSPFFGQQTVRVVAAPIAFAVTFFFYEAIQLALWGRTVGKRFAGIKVVSAIDEGPPNVLQALVRAAVYAFPPGLRPVPILNVMAGIFWLVDIGLLLERPHRQALHDRLAGTLVQQSRQ
jgi:uncharacterized RDD family membrane protein YckC